MREVDLDMEGPEILDQGILRLNWPDDFINKIICGDCLEVMKEMPDECVDMILTSPPYSMFKDYEKEVSYTQHLDLLYDFILESERILKQGRHLIINIDDPHRTMSADGNECLPTHALLTSYIHQQRKELRYKDTIIWAKIRSAHQRGDGKNVLYGSYPYPNGIPIKNNCEFILLAAKKGKPKYYSKKIKDKSKINWDFFKKYCSSPWYISAERNRQHPAPFPHEFASVCIKLFSFENEIILDPFIGSGTTGRASKDLKRNFIGIEISPEYCKIAEERLAQGIL